MMNRSRQRAIGGAIGRRRRKSIQIMTHLVVVAIISIICCSVIAAFVPEKYIERRLVNHKLSNDRNIIPHTDGSINGRLSAAHYSRRHHYPLQMNSENNCNDQTGNNGAGGDKSSNNNSNNNKSDNNNNNKNVVIDELSWRVAKVRLEEAAKPKYLKSKPLKLSYEVSQKWIQRNWGPKTKQEFEDLVANGNLRTPYISKRPEEYYGERGEWISWDHYLLGECKSEDIENTKKGKEDGDDGGNNGGSQKILKWQ